jgi:hypothetical protein
LITETLLEQIKEILSENERLFTKLHKVGMQYEAIDFDESGLYQEEEDIVLGRWQKLSSKIALALNESLDDTNVKVVKKTAPNDYRLRLECTPKEEEAFTLSIDYATVGEIAISV